VPDDLLRAYTATCQMMQLHAPNSNSIRHQLATEQLRSKHFAPNRALPNVVCTEGLTAPCMLLLAATGALSLHGWRLHQVGSPDPGGYCPCSYGQIKRCTQQHTLPLGSLGRAPVASMASSNTIRLLAAACKVVYTTCVLSKHECNNPFAASGR
jgi:hypothetical protein